MGYNEFRLLGELSLDDILLVSCLPSERRILRQFVSDGMAKLNGRFFKRATITKRGLDVWFDVLG
jgi:hypothetical protein